MALAERPSKLDPANYVVVSNGVLAGGDAVAGFLGEAKFLEGAVPLALIAGLEAVQTAQGFAGIAGFGEHLHEAGGVGGRVGGEGLGGEVGDPLGDSGTAPLGNGNGLDEGLLDGGAGGQLDLEFDG